jgi:hypothetical protein
MALRYRLIHVVQSLGETMIGVETHTLATVTMWSTVFWKVTPCSLAEFYRRFGQKVGNMFLWNVGKFIILVAYESRKTIFSLLLVFQFQAPIFVFTFYNQNFITLLQKFSQNVSLREQFCRTYTHTCIHERMRVHIYIRYMCVCMRLTF